MKNLTHLKELIKSRDRLLIKTTLSEIEQSELNYLKNEIIRLSNLSRGIRLAESLMKDLRHIFTTEKIYDDDYFCITFKVKNQYKIDEEVSIFKGMCKSSYYEEQLCNYTNKNILVKYNSPPVFYGYHKNYNYLKLSIPVFLYNNDIDIMKFIDRHFKSLTKKFNKTLTP